MEVAETLKKIIQEIVVPELNHLKTENAEIKAALHITNKRLDDINAILIDHSRRIDETNKRIDELRADLIERIDRLNSRVDRLYEVIVRRDEHEKLEFRVMKLEQDVAEIKSKIAA